MLEALIALAALAGNTVVAAATTDAWEAARRGFARLLGCGDAAKEQLARKRLEETRRQLAVVTGQELEQARVELARAWQVRMADLLEEDPSVEAELRAVVEEIRAHLPAVVVSAVDHSVAAGRDVTISASQGGLAAGVIHRDVVPPGPTWPGPADG
jgi:alpha-D-ribose 1-methylphosphonate 5-triphosphate synthase subunit PhnL